MVSNIIIIDTLESDQIAWWVETPVEVIVETAKKKHPTVKMLTLNFQELWKLR